MPSQALAMLGPSASEPAWLLSLQLRVRHDAARASKDGLVLIDVALRPSETRYVALQVGSGFWRVSGSGVRGSGSGAWVTESETRHSEPGVCGPPCGF